MSTIAPPRRATRERARAPRPTRLPSEAQGAYIDDRGTARELVLVRGASGTTLLIDRIAASGRDARLLAHLAADEPPVNAKLIAQMYLTAPRPTACREVRAADLHMPHAEGLAPPATRCPASNNGKPLPQQLIDQHGNAYRLQPVLGSLTIPDLRWCRTGNGAVHPVSVRRAIGALEAYEPVLTMTRAAIARHGDDTDLSVVVLRAEHERAINSPVVLNRRLREAVQAAIARGEVSASEIALRCGRSRSGERGCVSGETSWLARRIGHVAEAGESQPTPWVHTDVLALIAREGLGLDPREVEA